MEKRKITITSNDNKMWATRSKKDYGYFVVVGLKRDTSTKNHGHFEIRLPGNNLLGTEYSRGYIKKITRNGETMFIDSLARKTRTMKLQVDSKGAIEDFAFIEN